MSLSRKLSWIQRCCFWSSVRYHERIQNHTGPRLPQQFWTVGRALHIKEKVKNLRAPGMHVPSSLSRKLKDIPGGSFQKSLRHAERLPNHAGIRLPHKVSTAFCMKNLYSGSSMLECLCRGNYRGFRDAFFGRVLGIMRGSKITQDLGCRNSFGPFAEPDISRRKSKI